MKKLDPFNIDLMFAPDEDVRFLRPTTRTDIYEGVTNNFNDEGLFSTITFGRLGTEERDNNFSYIKLNGNIIHPAVYNVLKRLRSLYEDIMMGTQYAVWNPETKDFEPSDMFSGETGMAFFCRHIHELEPEKRTSKKRNLFVDVFNKYKDRCLMHNHLVLPAGLRDIEISPEGNETQDEINDEYRRLISIASNINLIGGKTDDQMVDIPRRNLQITANKIYANLQARLDGKQGLVAGKWGGRKITVGTRNVISSPHPLSDVLHGPRSYQSNAVTIGVYQLIKGASPLVVNKLKERFLDAIFTDPSQPTLLIDPKTLQLTQVNLDPYIWDSWGTTESLEKKFNSFANDKMRNNPVRVFGYYLYLVYRKGDEFKLFRDINDLPDPSMRQYVHPITFAELYYLCNYEGWYDLRCTFVRYPVNNARSVSVAKLYIKTNSAAEGAYELGDDWKTRIGFAREYPGNDNSAVWVNTAIPPLESLSQLGGDYDGDTITLNILFSREAIEEINRTLNSRSYVINTKGTLISSANTNIPKRVFLAWTGEAA